MAEYAGPRYQPMPHPGTEVAPKQGQVAPDHAQTLWYFYALCDFARAVERLVDRHGANPRSRELRNAWAGIQAYLNALGPVPRD